MLKNQKRLDVEKVDETLGKAFKEGPISLP